MTDASLQQELFPNNTMKNVTPMIENGLSLVRDRYARLSQYVAPNINVTPLLATPMTPPFDWDSVLSTVALASMSLAYRRYTSWYDTIKCMSAEAIRDLEGPDMHSPASTSVEAFNEGPVMHTRAQTAPVARIAHAAGAAQSLLGQ